MEISELLIDYETIAEEIDRLTESADYSGLKEYLSQIEQNLFSVDPIEKGPILYYFGTAYETLAGLKISSEDLHDKNLYIEHRKKSLLYLRKAIALLEKDEGQKALLLCAYINYANALVSCSRVMEALLIYRKAIHLAPKFAMALGNYGRALRFYANTVNDSGHRAELHCFAYQAIKRALDMHDPNMYETACRYFRSVIEGYEATGKKEFLESPIIFDHYSMGDNEERIYREWCLENHLFLNPLNDLIEQETAFAHDPLVIARCSEEDDTRSDKARKGAEPPKYFSMLNQLKEEYIYARFLLYEGTEKLHNLHYADKEVRITLSSFDYVEYSIRLEQIKASFRILFSIIDKVAFAVNSYWKLGYKERSAKADKVFLSNRYPQDNVALLALFWSYNEFSAEFYGSEEGAERNLKVLRNALEHKFVKIHERSDNRKLQLEDDDFYHISEEELKKYALRLLEIAREFIMEFIYAIDIEENKHSTNGKIILPLRVADFDDAWKI